MSHEQLGQLISSLTKQMMDAKDLDALWAMYAGAIVEPSDPTDKHRVELKRAFYSGAGAIFELFMRMTDEGEEKAMKVFDNVQHDLEVHMAKVLVGLS